MGAVVERLLPLYFLILLGFLAGRLLKVEPKHVAKLLIYLLVPMVVFNGVSQMQLDPTKLSLPFLYTAICMGLCLLFLNLAGLFFGSPAKNILAYAGASGNTGYFGIPVAVVLFGDNIVGLMVLTILGFTFFENTLGFYVTARGHHSAREAFMRLLKIPTVYAFVAGLIANSMHVKYGVTLDEAANAIRHTYSVLGMMLIGMGVAQMKSFKIDIKFTLIALVFKFVVFPSVVLTLIYFDREHFHFYSREIHRLLLFISLVPLPANSVAFAELLNTEPAKMSVAVLISTVLALFYIPLIMSSQWAMGY